MGLADIFQFHPGVCRGWKAKKVGLLPITIGIHPASTESFFWTLTVILYSHP
jgi:hypothetical protein